MIFSMDGDALPADTEGHLQNIALRLIFSLCFEMGIE